MNIREIIDKHYNELYNLNPNDNKVISEGRTNEDILNDVCLTAIRKYKNLDISEDEGLSYIKKFLYSEQHFKYARKSKEFVHYTDIIPDMGYLPDNY